MMSPCETRSLHSAAIGRPGRVSHWCRARQAPILEMTTSFMGGGEG